MKRFVTLAAWGVGLAICILFISRTTITTDMSAFLPRTPAPAQEILVEQLKSGVISRLILVALEGASTDVLARFDRTLAADLRGAEEFQLVTNGELAGLAPEQDWVWRNRYLLSPAITSGYFSSAALRSALERDLAILRSSAAIAIKKTLPADPTGEVLALADRLVGDGQPAQRDGVWISHDGGRALMMVQTRAAGFDLDGQTRAIDRIKNGFARLSAEEPERQAVHLVTTGPGVFAVQSRLSMQAETSRLSVLASGIVAILLLSAFGTFRVLPIAFIPVISGVAAGITAVDVVFGFVHGITLGFGVTLIGEAVDFAIYVYKQTAPGMPTAATVPRIWPTLRLGVLTSIVGFSAMLLSSFTGFAQLGLFTVCGLLVAVAATRWILPVVLDRGFSGKLLDYTTAFLPRLALSAQSLRIPICVASLIAVAIIVDHRQTLWETELLSLSPVPVAEQKLDQELRRDIGAPDVRYMVVIRAADRQAALERSESLAPHLAALVAGGVLGGYDTPDRYLPSFATQRARQQALPDAATLRNRLAEALVGLPFQQDAFEPFVADVEAARGQPLLDRKGLGAGLASKVDSLLFERAHEWVALVPLRAVTAPGRLSQAIADLHLPSVALVDLKGESDRLLSLYRNEALHLAMFGALAIVVLLALALRSPRRVWAIVAPLAAAVAITTAGLVAVEGRLSIFNLFGLLLVVAVGSNYSLFLEAQRLEAPEAGRTISSLVLANLCTVCGFGVLALSRVAVLNGIGTTVAVGTLLSLIFSIALSPHRATPESGREPVRS